MKKVLEAIIKYSSIAITVIKIILEAIREDDNVKQLKQK